MRALSVLLGFFVGATAGAVAAFGPGCGECTFEETIAGVVSDQHGGALEGVTIEACHGDRCDVGASDAPCVSTTSAADGRFTLDVPMCRPRAAACELRPITLEKEGCEPLTVQPERGVEAILALECGP
jgi:hypothetical protein